MQFKNNKNHNCSQILFDHVDLLSLVVAISWRLRHTISALRRTISALHRTIVAFRRTIAALRRTIPALRKHTRTFWRTAPAHFIAPFHVLQLRNGVQLQSRATSEEDKLTMSCWTPVLTSAIRRFSSHSGKEGDIRGTSTDRRSLQKESQNGQLWSGIFSYTRTTKKSLSFRMFICHT